MHILLIEDDYFVAEFEKRVLKDHVVTHAATLHDAFTVKLNLELGAGEPIDLIILDLQLPRKVEFQGQRFYDSKEVINVVDSRFEGIPVVIISAFLEEEIIKYAIERKMFCIDKKLLAESQAFLNLLITATEVSTIMRSTHAFVQHLTQDAVLTATHPSAPPAEQTKAKLYLASGTTVILLPWVMIIYGMYSRSVLHDTSSIPYYTEILWFCGFSIATILGVTPWLIKFFQGQK